VRAAAARGSAIWSGYGLPWDIQPGGEENVALGQCRVRRCLALVWPGCGGDGRVGSSIQEFLGNPGESSPAGRVQRGHAIAASAVDVRATFQQQAYQV